MTKKDWKQAQNLLKQLKESPGNEAMTAKLDAAKEYARSQRAEEKWTGKIKRLFGETEDIITEYFSADKLADMIEDLEDDLKAQMEEAAADTSDVQPQSAPAAGSVSPTVDTVKSGS